MAKHEIKKFKVDHDDEDKSDDVVHQHQTTEDPWPLLVVHPYSGVVISDHDEKDKSEGVVNPSPLLVVHPHQMTGYPSPQEEGVVISDHDEKDKSEDVVNPSLEEEGGHICLSVDEDEFDEDYPPIRRVEEFTDDYGLLAPYFIRFPFDDEDFDDDVEDFDYKNLYGHPCSKRTHQTIVKYINQIRESFAFDLDCFPPLWFYIGRLKPILLTWPEGYFSCEKAYKDFVDSVLEAAKVAVEEDINYAIASTSKMPGKGFKFVGLEKGVRSSTYCVLFLTINVMEVEVANVTEDEGGALRKIIQADGGDGAEGEGALWKTIQAGGGEGSRKTIPEDGAEGEGALKKRKIIQADGAGEGASVKTIQAILGRNSHGIYLVQQWRMKPDA